MSEKLKPCPFCGGKAVEVLDDLLQIVRCTVCEAEAIGDGDHVGVTAIAAWNRRAPSPSLREALEVTGQSCDTIENGLAAAGLPLPATTHVEGLTGVLRDVLDRLRALTATTEED